MELNNYTIMEKLSLIIIAMLLPLLAAAESVTIDNLVYDLNTDGTAKVAQQNTSLAGEIVIPSEVVYNEISYTVTAIVDEAFSQSAITSILIPSSIASIGENCFSECWELKSVSLPTSITVLPVGCFYDCVSLDSITIPASVEIIGDNCFFQCYSLGALNIPHSVKSIGSGILVRCDQVASVTVEDGNTVYDSRDNCNAIIETATGTMIAACPKATIPQGVTALGSDCFMGLSIKSIDIPTSVTSLGDRCFSWCEGLTYINLPANLTSIGEMCFSYCYGLTSITSMNTTPPAVGYCGWGDNDDIVRADVKLYVPQEALDAYKAAPIWQDFNIQPIKTNGIDDLQVTGASGDGKFIKDGQVVIRHGDRLYNVNGQIIK